MRQKGRDGRNGTPPARLRAGFNVTGRWPRWPTGTVTATIPVGAGSVNIAIDAAGTTAYVTSLSENTATNTITGLVTGFSTPRGITIARN